MSAGGLGSWILSLSAPVARQILTSLGIGIVSYTGFSYAMDALLGYAKAAWTGQSAEVANYVAMAGGNTALSIIAGALVARVSLIPLKRFRLL